MILNIWKKEVRSLFLSPSFYGVLFLCSVLFSWRFVADLRSFAQNYQTHIFQLGQVNYSMHIHFGLFAQHMSYLNLVLIFFTPVLTMKLVAEERSSGSLKLLLSSPISSWQIIGGKYLAGVTVVFFIVLLSLVYPLFCVFFADIDWVLFLGSYLGMYFLGCLYVAMGVFSSSIGTSTMVSLVVGILLNIVVWLLGMNSELMDYQWLREISQHLSLNYHISGLMQGVFRLSTGIFFFSLILFFLILSERFLALLKWK